MAFVFPGSKVRIFFRSDETGSYEQGGVTIAVGPGAVTLSGLLPLPEGSEYYLTLNSTPVKPAAPEHDRGAPVEG